MELKMKNLLIALSIMMLVSGCVHKNSVENGSNFDELKVNEIVAGKTTENQLLSMFGEPSQKEVINDHEVKWVYEYETSKEVPASSGVKSATRPDIKLLNIWVKDGIAYNHMLSNQAPLKLP